MSRPLKFRAWNKDANCFFTEDHVKEHLFGFLSKGFYPVMQYTGLKDKNGIEVYEHDLVEYKGELRIVLFRHGAFTAVDKKGFWLLLESHLLQDGAVKKGNIWEDREALETEYTKQFISMVIDIVGGRST